MPDPIRYRIISAIFSRAKEVRRENAYKTDIGRYSYLLRRSAQQVPCIAVFPGLEETAREYKDVIHTMTVRLEGIQELGDDDPVEISEKILADLIEIMTGHRWVLDYTSGGVEVPEIGDTVTGQTSGAESVLESWTTDSGAWADGDAAGTLLLRRKVGEYMSEDLDIGSEVNLATTDGSIVHSGPEALVTGDLADDIVYAGGGIADFPESDQLIVGSSAEFNIIYRTLQGNPYSQPQ